MNYLYFSTPGHGYLKVPTTELLTLGIHSKISRFSRFSVDGLYTFLEHDKDAQIFFRAKELIGEQVLFKEISVNSEKIKSNSSFDPEWVIAFETIIRNHPLPNTVSEDQS